MISTKQLHYALAVQKTLHFKKASELCHISQSALSTAMNELEKHLGVQIFERDNKKVLVTSAGKEVLAQARDIMQQIKDLENFSVSQRSPLSFPITVGAIPTIAPYLLPRIFAPLYKQFPEAQINIVEDQSHVLLELVQTGEIDTAILALPYPCNGLICLEFWQEDFYWVTLKNDKYAQKTEISNEEIDQSNLMLLKDGHCLKDQILDLCKLSEQTANHGFGAASLTTLIHMVSGGLGTTLVPAMALDQLESRKEQLSAIHLNETGPHRRIAFIMRPNYSRLSCVEALIDICKKALSKEVL